ncbi:MAG: SulP family inorganic anion transporter [Reichenbachiella sp.]
MKSNSNVFSPFKNFKSDIPSSIVVFLVAMPLCLGIALASGAPLYSGLIAGIVGGIIVGSLSGSHTGVSGPAAGLAVVVLNSITELGTFELFLVAVVLAGIIQISIGLAGGGVIAYYFPSSIIMGMLSGIGIIIFLKQLPHAVGDDRDTEGDMEFFQADGENTFTEIISMFDFLSPGAVIITVVSLIILLLWESKFVKSINILQLIPGPLLAVAASILLALSFQSSEVLNLRANQMVNLPVSEDFSSFLNNFTTPDFSGLLNSQVYIIAIVIAVVASLETLLCVEAADKIDRHKRITPTNKELVAQGVGNIVSGLIGGLPVTQVIVRSSANVQSGAKTKASAVIHGILILISIILIPNILNLIPLAALAAILLIVGYKLARPTIFKKLYHQGKEQFVPFLVTVLGIIFTDLLIGLAMGLAVAIFFILYNTYKFSFRIKKYTEQGNDVIHIELAQELTFFNKANMVRTLESIPVDSKVILDASHTTFIHYDVLEIIENFLVNAEERNIELELLGSLSEVETHS